jgi:hypothetical protein
MQPAHPVGLARVRERLGGWLTAAVAAWRARPRTIPTVLAPALPALVLLGIIVAATADPPYAGPLHLTGVTAGPCTAGAATVAAQLTYPVGPPSADASVSCTSWR